MLIRFQKRNLNILTEAGFNGFVGWKTITSSARSTRNTFVTILTSMDSSKNSITTSPYFVPLPLNLLPSSEAIEMILSPEGPDDEDLEDEK